jgi:preprotein translocase subunit SecA
MEIAALYTRARSRNALKQLVAGTAKIATRCATVASLTDELIRERFRALSGVAESDRVTEGFALVCEVASRTLGMRPFDVQVTGGLALLAGKLAEMRTGEGKTLTIVAPAAVLALEGRGVHVVTANSYLARRDAELMRPVYEALGLSVAFIGQGQSPEEKRSAYAADVTYGVGQEFGFDYLRDNLVRDAAQRSQRGLYVAIVDEVDSILIDEARTPLILSGPGVLHEDAIRAIDKAVSVLSAPLDYLVDPRGQNASLTEAGYSRVEASLVSAGLCSSAEDLYSVKNLHLVRRIHAAVRAYGAYRKDRDYVVDNGELLLVDLGTGRKMPGRRLEDGLHEALEAKEGVRIQTGTVTRATITYQNYFGLYERLAGLTGTALTEADEFSEFYGLDTVVIPTNKPVARIQNDDVVYLTKAAKFVASAEEIARRQKKGQPVLAGCGSVRDAEVLSRLLSQQGVVHEVLTAKHLEREAHIIAAAGRPGAVTVATNMAGRGTDILLGGEKPVRGEDLSDEQFAAAQAQWSSGREAVLRAGGLYVLGTERSGIRRVDNQLAGRSGRQGDVGEVQFYLSLEDDLLRVFSQSRQLALVRRMVAAQGGALQGKTVAAMVQVSQRQFEGQGFEARRSLMKYDSVLANQRRAVYELRNSLVSGEADNYCEAAVQDAVTAWAARMLPADQFPQEWDLAAAKKELAELFSLRPNLVGWVHKDEMERDGIVTNILSAAQDRFDSLKAAVPDSTKRAEVVFDVLTDLWTEHLMALEELRLAVPLKARNGLNPVFQYHKDAFALFNAFIATVELEVAQQVLSETRQQERDDKAAQVDSERRANARVAVELEKRWVRRNESCPCGSGIRFKACHGKLK